MSLFHTNTLLGASGSGGDPLYVDDVFSVDLWDGTGSTQTITNGIDLAGEGGMVWTKAREVANENHMIHDSERGKTGSYYDALQTNVSNADYTDAPYGPTSFNSDGFTLGGNNAQFNGNGDGSYCSWTFRKAPGFFDIVTYTGNGANRTIAHNLGSVPGSIWVKKRNSSSDSNWKVWHRSLPNTGTDFLTLNESGAYESNTNHWNSTAPTSTHFSLGTNVHLNNSGDTYVAYIFAHDDQSFGTNSDEAIISCGTYSGGNSPNNFVNIGFEPQFLISKRYDGAADWVLSDMMRGAGNTSGQYKGKRLFPNTTSADSTYNDFSPKPTGFDHHSSGDTSENFIYIAIRRPHKPPESATDVFKAVTYSGSGSAQNITGVGFVPDWMWSKDYSASNNGWYHDRLRVQWSLDSSGTGGEQDRRSYLETLGQDGINFVTGGFDLNRSGSNHVAHFMKRAPGFFDIVTYIGNGANRTINHNLEAVPEMIIIKNLESTFDWTVYHASRGNTKYLKLNEEDAENTSSTAFNSTTPTASVFSLGDFANTNQTNQDIVAWLWASLPGICDIGQYSGSSSAVTVDCGFAAAPRYILIKAVNRSEPWYVFDHARGIVSGNDPSLQLDKTNAQNSGDDVIDPTSSGFTVNTGYGSGFNESGNTYIYLAIA